MFIKGVISTYNNVMNPSINAKTNGMGMVLLPHMYTMDFIILQIKMIAKDEEFYLFVPDCTQTRKALSFVDVYLTVLFCVSSHSLSFWHKNMVPLMVT